MTTGIYKILNRITGKFYIGSAINVEARWRRHKHDLIKNQHQNILLQRAWNKYWDINFEFYIIELCSKENLISKEQSWLDVTRCHTSDVGYNLTPTAGNSLGVKHSEETRKRMSEAKQKMTKETKEKMRLISLGKKLSAEHKAKISAGREGSIHSLETRLKISQSNKGKIISEETRKKISAGNRNLGTKRGKYKARSLVLTKPPIILSS